MTNKEPVIRHSYGLNGYHSIEIQYSAFVSTKQLADVTTILNKKSIGNTYDNYPNSRRWLFPKSITPEIIEGTLWTQLVIGVNGIWPYYGSTSQSVQMHFENRQDFEEWLHWRKLVMDEDDFNKLFQE